MHEINDVNKLCLLRRGSNYVVAMVRKCFSVVRYCNGLLCCDFVDNCINSLLRHYSFLNTGFFDPHKL
jgi:hypothetical protein